MATEKFDAFISYSHADSGNLAPFIQRAMENIGKPWYRLRRNLNIFRDETNLTASPELWQHVEEGLLNSEFFILFASPVAASSGWVKREVETWLNKGPLQGDGTEKLLIVLTSGDIVWDRNANDFDFSVTNCLPRALSGKFREEPLWIDLRPYVTAEGKIKGLDYRSPGFVTAMTRIIGAIKGIDPREVESEELKRTRSVWAVVTSGVIVIMGLIFMAVFFFLQRQQEKKMAISYNLAAAGKEIESSDNSRALMFFAYAYAVYPADGSFSEVQNYYDFNFAPYELHHNGLADTLWDHFTLDQFYQLVKPAEHAVPENLRDNTSALSENVYSVTDDSTYQKVNLCIPHQQYYYVSKDGLTFYDFHHRKKGLVPLPYSDVTSYISIPLDRYIYFKVRRAPALLLRYDLYLKSFSSVVRKPDPKGEADRLAKDWMTNEHLLLSLSDNGRYLVEYPSDRIEERVTKAILTDLYSGQERVLSLKLPKTVIREGLNIRNDKLLISNDGKTILSIVAENSNNGVNHNLVYRAIPDSLLTDLYEGGSDGSLANNNPTVFKWGDRNLFFFYGTVGGQVVTVRSDTIGDLEPEEPLKDYSAKIYSNAQGGIGTVTAITYCSHFIISASSGGYLHFFTNEIYITPDHATQMQGYENFANTQIPAQGEINGLTYDRLKNVLYIQTDAGEIFTLQPNLLKLKLSKDGGTLVRQLLNSGFPDLSRDEKKKYQLTLLPSGFNEKK